MERLDAHDIADNTLVVFLNDNGGGESTERYPPIRVTLPTTNLFKIISSMSLKEACVYR
jgi:arylsulfatase A-like enzyme